MVPAVGGLWVAFVLVAVKGRCFAHRNSFRDSALGSDWLHWEKRHKTCESPGPAPCCTPAIPLGAQNSDSAGP